MGERMANEDTPAGFLGRWSRRKAEVREGKPVVDPEPASARVTTPVHLRNDPAPDPQTQTPAPTLDDVQSLTPESDYTPFMARGVTSDVKNAAMKKLFTDPHFNVMDRMDVYIDDYGQPDPIPLAMLRHMNGTKFLNLFDDTSETSASESSQLVAQSGPAQPLSPTDTTTHDHADLRLQPDPTPRPEGTGPEPA